MIYYNTVKYVIPNKLGPDFFRITGLIIIYIHPRYRYYIPNILYTIITDYIWYNSVGLKIIKLNLFIVFVVNIIYIRRINTSTKKALTV